MKRSGRVVYRNFKLLSFALVEDTLLEWKPTIPRLVETLTWMVNTLALAMIALYGMEVNNSFVHGTLLNT